MTKKQRVADVHFYEWSVIRWFTSDTRAQLDPTGRGIFRDLIDLCYAQGSIPKDPELLCRKTDATREQFNRVWPIIEHHFHQHPKQKNVLVNHVASAYRTNYFRYLKRQKSNGNTGGRPKGGGKPNGDSEIKTSGLTTGESQEEKRRDDKRREETTSSTGGFGGEALISEFPMTTAAVRSYYATADPPIIHEIIQLSAHTLADLNFSGPPDLAIANAVHRAKAETPKQNSPALFRRTVPQVLRSWGTTEA